MHFNEPVRILKLFCHEVEEVPAPEGKQAGIKSYSDAASAVVSIERLAEVGCVTCTATQSVYCNCSLLYTHTY
jgi:hypothetical protein